MINAGGLDKIHSDHRMGYIGYMHILVVLFTCITQLVYNDRPILRARVADFWQRKRSIRPQFHAVAIVIYKNNSAARIHKYFRFAKKAEQLC